MTSLLSGISGHFSRQVVLGTLLPVAIFVLVAQSFVEIVSSERWGFLETLQQVEPSWRLASHLAVILVMTGLLYVLNIPLIRLYEGYPWEHSFIGRWRIRAHRRLLRESETRKRFLEQLRRALRGHSGLSERVGILRTWEDETSRVILEAFPKEGSVLPTRLGNTIRSFENYPERQYGMSGIDLWTRLVAKIPADFADAIGGIWNSSRGPPDRRSRFG